MRNLTFCVFSFRKRCTVHDEWVRARCTTSIILTFTDHGHIPCTMHDKQNSAFTMHDRPKIADNAARRNPHCHPLIIRYPTGLHILPLAYNDLFLNLHS